MAATYTWDATKVELKAYIGITDTSEDVQLELYLAAAVDQGDTYCNNPFTDDDDVDVAHPEQVKLGVFEWVRHRRDLGHTGGSGRPIGLTSAKTGDLSEGYAYSTRIAGGIWSPKIITDAVKGYWRSSRLKMTQ
jgi:hypothetical protein